MHFNRYIAGILIFCFSVFLGHNLIPHHHYTDLFGGPVSSACPLQHGEKSGNQDHGGDGVLPPTHCHAFNDVVLEKFSVPETTPVRLLMKLMEIPLQTRISRLPAWNARSLDNSRPLPGYDDPATVIRALRAPPALG
jgi:hypothetical protein